VEESINFLLLYYPACIIWNNDAIDAVLHVKNVLSTGGFLVTYSPFFEPTKEIRTRVAEAGFAEVTTLECIGRALSFTDRGTQPATVRGLESSKHRNIGGALFTIAHKKNLPYYRIEDYSNL